jgi:ubiquinone/menaquinone biosynthesis C-methylase UbiE
LSFQLSGSAPEIYENTMVPLWFGRWAKALLELVSLKPGERILDVACGTGVTTRFAKKEVGADGEVIGLDINAGMLSAARELSTELDIVWMESDVVNVALPSHHFDAIICQHGYHYFPDQPAALKEFHRLLKPSGRIAISIWDGHSAYTQSLCSAVEKFISPEVAVKQRSQRETPTARALEAGATQAGFSNVSVIRQELVISVPLAAEFVPLHLGSMPIAPAFLNLSDNEKKALVADVAHSLESYVVGDQLVYPDAVNVITGIK